MNDDKKDCFQPVCDKEDPFSSMRKLVDRVKKSQDFDDEDELDNQAEQKIECPITRDILGYFTWSYLHTMAVYYPDNPTEVQKQKMINFIDGFAEFYPCKTCRFHFQKDIIQSIDFEFYQKQLDPIKVDSRQDLSIWFCERHNYVNKWLNKEQYDCSFDNIDQRWRLGFQKCRDKDKGSFF